MQISLQKQNLDYLKNHFPDFYKNLSDKALVQEGLTIQSGVGEGNYDMSLNGAQCCLHSQYDIEREMRMLFKPVVNDEKPVIVIFGLGYGHCLDYIRQKKIKYKRVVIFEPCTNILYEVLKKRNVLTLLGMKDLFLHLLNRPNDMAQYLLKETMESKTVKVIYHISYMTLFKEVYDNMIRSFKNERIAMESSIATTRAKAIQWTAQQLKSIQKSFTSASVLVGKFKGIPGIIASAGPSLEKHFSLLKNIGDKAVIVSPGSSIRIFNKNNINSHIAMVIDASDAEASFFSDFRLNSVMIGSYRLHEKTYESFPNDVFNIVIASEYITRYFYHWQNKEPFIINDHPSVAIASIDILYLLGCDPIIFVGQDLCYYNYRNYADDSINAVLNENKRMIDDFDIYGNVVQTNYGYKAMQNNFENVHNSYKGKVRMFNATEGGLGIHGMENVKFSDMYEKFIKNRPEDVADIFKNVINSAQKIIKTDSINIETIAISNEKTVDEFFSHILEECNITEKIINDKEAEYIPLARLVSRGVAKNRINNEILRIKEHNKKLNDNEFFKQVIFPNIHSSLEYIRAGSKHVADAGDEWEGELAYERKLDENALQFINLVKALILREMVSNLAGTALKKD